MHFLTTEEHYRHKILSELREGSILSKKVITVGNDVCPCQNFRDIPECIWVVQMAGNTLGQHWHKETAVVLFVNKKNAKKRH